MELFAELFLTASLALFLSFLVAKLVAVAMAAGESDSKPDDFLAAMTCAAPESETKVESLEEVVETVDCVSEVIDGEGFGDRSEISDGLPVADSVGESSIGAAEESAASEGVSVEPEASKASGGESEASEVESGGGFCEDDWEGIERDELESDFAAAVEFVESRSDGGGSLPGSFRGGGDVEMELYGLRKVATEGACHERLGQGLGLSDRAKWHAWQRLGNMTRERAMENFVTILSENIPGWMEHDFAEDNKQECSEGKKADSAATAVFSPTERKPKINHGVEKVDFTETSDLENKASG